MAENRQLDLFLIKETNGEARMKNISPTTLPHFHGPTFEDLDTFMLDFVVVYRTYDYTFDEHKLNLFPSILKDISMPWFMIFEGGSITTWAQMSNFERNIGIIVDQGKKRGDLKDDPRTK